MSRVSHYERMQIGSMLHPPDAPVQPGVAVFVFPDGESSQKLYEQAVGPALPAEAVPPRGGGSYNAMDQKKAGAGMTIQTVELSGERYVILREREFLELRERTLASAPAEPVSPPAGTFRDVVPLRVGGTPASEVLIQDRR